jgi:dTDP-4-amino-4,6-dideoxygalactose transaminase
LSPPDAGAEERKLLLDAFDSNWIAPLGPHVDAFETEFSERIGVAESAALSSGTAALHLALHILGVSHGDEVVLPSLTFAATANAITYVGARPVFVDCSPDTWSIDVDLLEAHFEQRRQKGLRMPKALISVDLYGQCSDYRRIDAICEKYSVLAIEDAAEALGATYQGRQAGSFGKCAAFSFNGNKIITTSGGGMLVSNDSNLIARARHLASQARDPAPHYEHSEIGYNYRLSNLLAAIGRGQLRGLDAKIERRRKINLRYREALGSIPGITFMPEAPYGRPNYWLTCILVESALTGASREDIRVFLESRNIETRPVWKPMHLQPVFKNFPVVGGDVAAALFETGLCLPSGSSLSSNDLGRVIEAIIERCSKD